MYAIDKELLLAKAIRLDNFVLSSKEADGGTCRVAGRPAVDG